MEKHVNTVCARDCYDTCELTVTTDADGHPVRMTGSSHDPITRGITCPRAAGDLKRLGRNRVDTPHISDGERLVPATWDEALTRVSHALTETLANHGPASTLYLDYAGNMGLATSQFSKRFWHAIGATMTDGAICSTSGRVGIRLHYGENYGINPADTGAFPLIVFWGFNAAVSAPHLWQLALEARKRRGAVIAVIDPIRTRTAASADHWVRPHPGTDVALAYGIIRELIHAGAVDADFITTSTTGFDILAAEAENWRPDRVHEITGVSPDTVKHLSGLYSDIRPSATMIGIGLQKCVGGADQVRAVSLIPAVLGMNRGFFYSSGDAHEVDSNRISGRSLTRTPGETVSHVALGDLLEQGRFRYVHISGHNPAVTLPNQKAIRRGLGSPEVFVTVQETHWTRTAEMADVVLPALTYLEKADLVIPWSHNRVSWSPPAVPVQTDGRPEHDISTDLARRLGRNESWIYEDPEAAIRKALAPALSDGDMERLAAGESVRLRWKPMDRYGTPSGKIEFVSSRAAAMGVSPIPVQPKAAAPAGLRYIQSATASYTHSQFTEVYGPIPADIELHPEDAEKMGIADGETVAVENERGVLECRARITDRVPVGTAWSPRQFEDRLGRPQNDITTGTPQEIGGGPTFNSLVIRVSKCS